MYSIEGLKNGISENYKHIKMYEDLIQKEKNTIKEYEGMIDVIEQKAKDEENFKKKIEIVRE